MTASEVSPDVPRQGMGCRGTFEGLPYEAAFLSDGPPSNNTVSRTAELAAQHGW